MQRRHGESKAVVLALEYFGVLGRSKCFKTSCEVLRRRKSCNDYCQERGSICAGASCKHVARSEVTCVYFDDLGAGSAQHDVGPC